MSKKLLLGVLAILWVVGFIIARNSSFFKAVDTSTVSTLNFAIPGTSVETGSQKAIGLDVPSGVGGSGGMGASEIAYPIMPPSDYPYADEALTVDERVYRKSATYGLVVANLTKYVGDLTEYFLGAGGRIMSSQIKFDGKYSYAQMVVKVPVEKFDNAILKVKSGVKSVFSENVSSKDDTASLVTANTRLDDLVTKKLAKEKEIIAAKDPIIKKQLELELAAIENQIKQATASLAKVKANEDYAAFTVTASDNLKYFKPSDPTRPDFGEVWDQIVTEVLKNLVILIMLSVKVLIYSVFWIPLLVIIKFLLPKKNQPQAS